MNPLTDMQRKVCVNVAAGMSWHSAAKQAGYKSPESDIGNWREDPRFLTLVAIERDKNADAVGITRQKVMDGLLEAVAMSKLVSDPHALIKAWREIGLMCGYYAPEIKRIDISITAKRAISQLEQLTDEELLVLAEKDITDATIISETPRLNGPRAAERAL